MFENLNSDYLRSGDIVWDGLSGSGTISISAGSLVVSLFALDKLILFQCDYITFA